MIFMSAMLMGMGAMFVLGILIGRRSMMADAAASISDHDETAARQHTDRLSALIEENEALRETIKFYRGELRRSHPDCREESSSV